MSQNDSTDVDRRDVLKGIVAGTATVAGGSGIASAAKTGAVSGDVSTEFVARFGDAETVRAEIDRHDVLDSLVDEGFVSEASPEELRIDDVTTGRPRNVQGGSVVVSKHVSHNGDAVTAIHVPVESADGRARITVVPEQDDAYAVVPGNGGDAFDYVDSSRIFDVSTSDCTRCCYVCNVFCWNPCCDCSESCCGG